MADVKEAVGATARMFWIYQAFALAAALLAFLPDRSATYTQAIAELRRLGAIRMRTDEVNATLAAPAERAIGSRIFAAVDAAARANGSTSSSSLEANASYILIDSGPKSLDFGKTSVGDLLDALDAYAANPRYAVLAPEPEALKTELDGQLAGKPGVVTSFMIRCDYPPDRCQGDVYVNPSGEMVVAAQHDLQFIVPQVRVGLDFGVRDLVAARYPGLGSAWLEAPALIRVRDEVAELAPAAAVARLQDLRKAEDRPISIFDVSLSGSAARLVAPVALAVLALAAWASASGLKRLGVSAGLQDAMFLPLVRTPPATVLRWGGFWFPLLVSEGLLLRAWNTGLSGWLAALASLGVQSWAALETFGIFSGLRAPRAPRPTGWRAWCPHGAVALSVAAAMAWSLMPATENVPPAAELPKERHRDASQGNVTGGPSDGHGREASARGSGRNADAAAELPTELPRKEGADEER